MKFKRHDLVWLHNDKTPYVVTRQTNISKDELIVARSYSPLKDQSSRQASIIKLHDIDQHKRPYSLKQILHSPMTSLITDYKRSLLKLIAYYRLYNIKIYVYGSTSWQYITNTQYLNDNSDIDLLIEINDLNYLYLLPDLTIDFSRLLKLRLDGELLFKNNKYVAINEWLNVADHESLLVKTNNHVYLSSKRDVLHNE